MDGERLIYWIDIDSKGTATVDDLLTSGSVTRMPGANIKAFNESALYCVKNMTDGDTVILDTVSEALETIRMDMKLGDELREDLFEVAAAKYLGGDSNYLNVYQAAQQTYMRRYNNLVRRAQDLKNVSIITVAHEDEGLEPLTGFKKLGPKVNPAMIDTLIGKSSDVFRLRVVSESIANKDGEVIVKAGARVLYLRGTDEHMAKYNVPLSRSNSIPKYILEPTMAKVKEALGARPLALVIYGPPGAGKTTLATSDARELQNKSKGNK